MKDDLQKYYDTEKRKGNLKNLNFEDLYLNFVDFQKSFFSENDEADIWKEDFDFLQLIYYRNSVLWMNINLKFDFINIDNVKNVNSLFFDYSNILTLTQNNLLAINYLCHKGLDHQASLIVRNHLELIELSLSIFGDSEMYEFYKKLVGKNGEEINRSIKFSSTTKINQKILKTLTEQKGFEIYEGFFKDLSDFKISHYKNYSSAAHPDRTTVWLSAYSVSEDDETLQTSYMGRRNKKTQAILFDVFLIEVILFQYVIAMQITNHKMNFDKYGKDSEKMAFLVTAVWHLYGIKLKKYMKGK